MTDYSVKLSPRSRDQRRLLDRAALAEGLKTGPWALSVALKAARLLLEPKPLPKPVPAPEPPHQARSAPALELGAKRPIPPFIRCAHCGEGSGSHLPSCPAS